MLALQRAGGNRAAAAFAGRLLQRMPYAAAYSESQVKTVLNDSEGRASPVNNQQGHPRQHVGRWEKAERFAEAQQKTKSVYVNTAAQDKAITSALAAPAVQAQLQALDVQPNVPTRAPFMTVPTAAVDVKVVKAKKKKGHAPVGPGLAGQIQPGDVKSWSYTSGIAQRAGLLIDSMGTGGAREIHIQTAYPVLD